MLQTGNRLDSESLLKNEGKAISGGKAGEERFSTWPWTVHQTAVKRMLFIIIIALSLEPCWSDHSSCLFLPSLSVPHSPPLHAAWFTWPPSFRAGSLGATSWRKLIWFEVHVPASQLPMCLHGVPTSLQTHFNFPRRNCQQHSSIPRREAGPPECPMETKCSGDMGPSRVNATGRKKSQGEGTFIAQTFIRPL